MSIDRENALILFTKNPELGKAKTRLAKTIGDKKALEIYIKLLQHTRELVEPLAVSKFLFYSDKIEENDNWNNNEYHKKVQNGADLGQRMRNAFEDVFNLGYKKVIIIGSDCYELNSKIVKQAFDLLNENDTVIGPTFDGGYYLLGMKELHKTLFENINWSTETVFEETKRVLENKQLTSFSLQKLTDIDEEKDLPAHWKV